MILTTVICSTGARPKPNTPSTGCGNDLATRRWWSEEHLVQRTMIEMNRVGCFSFVVPAKAGTHNPFRCEFVRRLATYRGHGVWVPAFAGRPRRGRRGRRN